jgi:hypothetical protein
MNLEGFKRDKKDMAALASILRLKKVVQSNPQPPSVPTVLQCVARPVEGWCNHGAPLLIGAGIRAAGAAARGLAKNLVRKLLKKKQKKKQNEKPKEKFKKKP